MLSSPERKAALEAAHAIRELAVVRSSFCRTAIVATGAVTPLLALIRSTGPKSARLLALDIIGCVVAGGSARCNAVNRTWHTADHRRSHGSRNRRDTAPGFNHSMRRFSGRSGAPPGAGRCRRDPTALVALLSAADTRESAKEDAALVLRRLAAGTEARRNAIVAAGGPGALASVLTSCCARGSNPAVLQAARTVSNLCRGRSSARSGAVITVGLLPPLVGLLSGTAADQAAETAAAALKHLATKNDEIRAAIIAAGALPRLVERITNAAVAAAGTGALEAGAALANLAAGEDDLGRMEIIESGCLPPLVACMLAASAGSSAAGSAANAIAVDALGNMAAHGVAENSDAMRNAIAACNAATHLIALLQSGSPAAQDCAVYAIQMLSIGSTALQSVMVAAGAAAPLRELARTAKPERSAEAQQVLDYLGYDENGVWKRRRLV